MATSAQRQFLISVVGIPDYFAAQQGGDVTSATTDVYNGGSLVAEVITAPAKVANIKVTRPYKPERDAPIIQKYRGMVGRWRTTVSVQPTDPDLIPVGKPDVYPNAILVGFIVPKGDASSGKESTMEMEFAVSGAASS